MTPEFLRKCIIEPVLWQLRYYDIRMAGNNSQLILMETCAVESDLGAFLGQLEGGPAVSIFGIEPFTYDDIWINFINSRPKLLSIINNFYPLKGKLTFGYELLKYNHQLACTIARIKYWRIPEPIPATLEERAKYWKKYYNTDDGKGNVEKYIKKVNKYLK